VIVDFLADWCTPCKMIEPVLAEIAKDFDGRVNVGRLNVDEHAEIAARYSIVSIPSILLFKGGENSTSTSGLLPRRRLFASFEPYLD
jgi:thioredoxin 1